jgi:hypothetical protein
VGLTEWVTPGEVPRIAMYARLREVGSRVGGLVRVPHPAPPDAPATVAIKQDRCPLPAPWTAAGEFAGFDWVDDDAVGWWAEAADPRQAAARMADSLTVGKGQAGVFGSDRRLAVVLPKKLLSTGAPRKGLLGKVGGLLENTNWEMTDEVATLWETDARALRGVAVVLAGRGFPFARLVRFDFTDGSALLGRTQANDILPRALRR